MSPVQSLSEPPLTAHEQLLGIPDISPDNQQRNLEPLLALHISDRRR
jgi:hypothetical protein